MAVNYANGLATRIEGSFLCCTRMEGLLKEELKPEVGYLFLNKKSVLDRKAFLLLKRFIQEKRINLIQAHSSSFFLAVLIKWAVPGLKIIWHDHYGRDLISRKPGVLIPFSRFFDLVICVNKDLENWARKELYAREVIFVRNFVPEIAFQDVKPRFLNPVRSVPLGGKDEFKIICLANLRPQKDHVNLLEAFLLVRKNYKNISLHIIGKTTEKEYEEVIVTFIHNNRLEGHVQLYGEQLNIYSFLQMADLGVLSSSSEGLPVALLEYGAAGLPVVCTWVGECQNVIDKNGKLVPPKDPVALAKAIEQYMEDPQERKRDAEAFKKRVKKNFSEEAVLGEVVTVVKEVFAATK